RRQDRRQQDSWPRRAASSCARWRIVFVQEFLTTSKKEFALKLLVTGGAGFIGSNFVRHLLCSRSDVELVNYDKLTYAGNPESLSDLAGDARYRFVRGDVADSEAVADVFAQGFDAAVNFAAETHVDRSIEDASPFLRTNVGGVMCLLEAARK